MKYNQPDYEFYVVRHDTARPMIESGWQYREDAEDQLDEVYENSGGRARILTRRAMGSSVWPIDPDNDADWYTEAHRPRRNPVRRWQAPRGGRCHICGSTENEQQIGGFWFCHGCLPEAERKGASYWLRLYRSMYPHRFEKKEKRGRRPARRGGRGRRPRRNPVRHSGKAGPGKVWGVKISEEDGPFRWSRTFRTKESADRYAATLHRDSTHYTGFFPDIRVEAISKKKAREIEAVTGRPRRNPVSRRPLPARLRETARWDLPETGEIPIENLYEHRRLKEHPPRMRKEEGWFLIECYSPTADDYIVTKEYRSRPSAVKDLAKWKAGHEDTLKRMEKILGIKPRRNPLRLHPPLPKKGEPPIEYERQGKKLTIKKSPTGRDWIVKLGSRVRWGNRVEVTRDIGHFLMFGTLPPTEPRW